MTMLDRFPYSRYHNPSYCDRCSDDGFFETPAWQAAWDLAARADAELAALTATVHSAGKPVDVARLRRQAPKLRRGP